MNNEKKVTIIALVALLIIVIGVSYAFFTAGISSEDSTTIKADAGTMKINYNGGSNITLSGIYPKDEAWATKVITVTGNNTTDAKMYYKLTLVIDSNTFLSSDPLQYELTSTNTSTNGEIITAVSKTNLTSTTIELGKGYFNKANNARHTYQLKIYYPKKASDQNANQGKEFSAHVEISSVKEDKATVFATAILANNEVKTPITTPGAEVSAYKESDVTATSTESVSSTEQKHYVTYGTGWEANGTKFNLTGTAVTTGTYANSYQSLVGKYLPYDSMSSSGSSKSGAKKTTTNLSNVYYVVSATSSSFTYKEITSNKNTTEALLASAEDDYGTSYYFRGSVTNNYVEFANKCWRIVRIGGDNTVKLILHNDNTTNASNPCSSANNSTTAAFAHYNGSTYTSAFNYNLDDNAYVGFMYGTAGSSTYEATHANTNKSTILTNLETWYNNNLKTYESVIDDNIFCNDKNISGSGLGYGTNTTDYMAYERLVTNKTPSLKCNGELSKITSKIGLITADELVYAGYAAYTDGSTSYLQENATGDYWWSLSPGDFSGYNTDVWNVNGASGDLVSFFGDIGYGVRSYISLRSSVSVTGEGTSENPYVVEDV